MVSTTATNGAPVKRACDRKVKCIGEGTDPCKNCISASLACTYNAIPQKKGMHEEELYKHDPLDTSRKRVLYWLLYMAERTFAIHRRRPISLYPTIHPPSLGEVPSDRPVAIGLELMINLYKTIDDTFVNLWNRVHNHVNPQWFAQLHTHLREAVPAYLECTEAQGVEIRVTQQWLRAMAWRLWVNQGAMSSVSQDTSMTFKFPIEISRDLLAWTHQFSQPAMEVHGVGLIEKLFDIACCLTDVVACTSSSPDAFNLGPRDYISRFLTLFLTLRGGQSRYLPLLLAKLQEVLPNLPLPRSLNLPQTLPTSSIGLSGGMVPSNGGDEYTALPSADVYDGEMTESIRRFAAQTGAQLPFSKHQQPMIAAPSCHLDDMSIFDADHTHSTSHFSGSAPRSGTGTATPGPYEPPMSQGHPSAQLPTTLLQHTHLQSHN
ncbi:hypothetical protein E8E11_005995 [Didymella keratinophila]|nr:hypothetical protein E8E11_005995 [Didymella keratinophila]